MPRMGCGPFLRRPSGACRHVCSPSGIVSARAAFLLGIMGQPLPALSLFFLFVSSLSSGARFAGFHASLGDCCAVEQHFQLVRHDVATNRCAYGQTGCRSARGGEFRVIERPEMATDSQRKIGARHIQVQQLSLTRCPRWLELRS